MDEPAPTGRAPPLHLDVLTLFPEFFGSPLVTGLVGKALRVRRAEVRTIDPRRFTRDRHRTVDDAPYGGGAGMVLAAPPWCAAIDAARARGPGPVVMMSPQGRPLTQTDLTRWAGGDHLVLVCGRYEGFDERIRARVDDEVSLGDFVLTGGEYAALAVIDGVVRLRPGTLGNRASAPADSFSDGLLEFPQYTRPERFEGAAVPEVLLGGDHRRVEAWRRAEQARRTRDRRPDLLESAALGLDARRALHADPRPPRGVLAVGVGAPEEADKVAPALARLGIAYRLSAVRLVGPGAVEAVAGLGPVLGQTLPGPRRRDRPEPIEVDPRARMSGHAEWAGVPLDAPVVALHPLAGLPGALDRPVVDPRRLPPAFSLVLGERATEDPPTGPGAGATLPPLRQSAAVPSMGSVAAAAVALDRIIGES